jgi:hypothetical protein
MCYHIVRPALKKKKKKKGGGEGKKKKKKKGKAIKGERGLAYGHLLFYIDGPYHNTAPVFDQNSLVPLFLLLPSPFPPYF